MPSLSRWIDLTREKPRVTFQQLIDFKDESEALYELLALLIEVDFQQRTLFKDWTIHDVIAHLHIFNWAAEESIRDGDSFVRFYKGLGRRRKEEGLTLRESTDLWLDENENSVRNRELLDVWREYYLGMAERLADVDPRMRVRWAGPDMSVRSSLTARLMETWAHAQEVYDLLGVERVDKDRIKNIAFLGMNTFGWTFKNRKLNVPENVPHVRLTAPSGEIWEWNEPDVENCVIGSATEFCQVVAQTRNIADTELSVIGDTATHWMSIAQCFAGLPEDPPAAGSRQRVG